MDFERLQAAIDARAGDWNLTISLPKIRYSQRVFLGSRSTPFRRALFVGIGHGHDAVVSLFEGQIECVDGVDPYNESDGSGPVARDGLQELAAAVGLESRLNIHVREIDEFLDGNGNRYDLIVLPDVLHHIYVTKALLSESEFFAPATGLFRRLREASTEDGLLAISEAPRHGLRPWLVKRGWRREGVKYETKQPAREWRSAAEAGGWRLDSTAPYVPYALRSLRPLLSVPPLPWFYANRYLMRFRAA